MGNFNGGAYKPRGGENLSPPRAQRILKLAAEVSAGLLLNGASVGSAEQAAQSVCLLYGISEAQVCALPSALTVSADCGGVSVTRFMRINSAGNDFDMLERYGRLYREIVKGASLEQAETRLAKLKKQSTVSIKKCSFGGGLACGAFCAFFGGTVCEFLLAGIIGFITSLISALLAKKGSGGVARTLLISLTGATLSVLFSAACIKAGLHCRIPLVMLGTIMTLIPGLALCNALRDVLSGDLYSGLYRILGGLAATAAIVLGYAFAGAVLSDLYALSSAGGGGSGFIKKYISCALGAVGFCMLMNARTGRLMLGCAAAIISYSVYVAAEIFSNEFTAYFLAGAAAYFCAITLSLVHEIPSGVFLTPAVVPLLPGAALYYAVDALVSSEFAKAAIYGCDAVYAFAGIACGIAAASVVTKLVKIIFARSTRTLRFLCTRSMRTLHSSKEKSHRKGVKNKGKNYGS